MIMIIIIIVEPGLQHLVQRYRKLLLLFEWRRNGTYSLFKSNWKLIWFMSCLIVSAFEHHACEWVLYKLPVYYYYYYNDHQLVGQAVREYSPPYEGGPAWDCDWSIWTSLPACELELSLRRTWSQRRNRSDISSWLVLLIDMLLPEKHLTQDHTLSKHHLR